MPAVIVRVPGPLRVHAAGAAEIAFEADILGDVLDALARDYPALAQRVLTPEGEVRAFVNVFVGDRNMNALGGRATRLKPDQVVSILPAVAGG